MFSDTSPDASITTVVLRGSSFDAVLHAPARGRRGPRQLFGIYLYYTPRKKHLGLTRCV